MISKFIKEGDKLELSAVNRKYSDVDEKPRVYNTKIYDIISEDTIEVLMPMEKTKLILLPLDSEYNVVFYGETGLFQCFVRVIDRYKSNNMFILTLEFISNLRKYQRREFYRFSCALEMASRSLEEEEVSAIEMKEPYVLQPNLPIRHSVIVDISGGGLRFLSTQKYEVDSFVYCSYNLIKGKNQKTYEIVGKVLAVKELPNRPGNYEHRVQYHNIDNKTREEIIRFIFEEERKNRKTE
ncbi:MAG: flagellar brake protein [Lachnospiraceae bacterium]|nr:flagellar brake protein [Lachnospiraceae bacterium]